MLCLCTLRDLKKKHWATAEITVKILEVIPSSQFKSSNVSLPILAMLKHIQVMMYMLITCVS